MRRVKHQRALTVLTVMWKVDITSQFSWTTFRPIFDEIRPGKVVWRIDSLKPSYYFYNRISSKTGLTVVQTNSAISLALIAARSVFHLTLRQCEKHSVCLSCSADSATEAISLALSCTERVFHIALRDYFGLEGKKRPIFGNFFLGSFIWY